MDKIHQSRTRKKDTPRDLINFIQLRAALPSDDLAIADLLMHTFLSTYKEKLPTVQTSEERKEELRNVRGRRKNGYVCVAELGYKIIGTFALIHPESPSSEAWRPNGATLRCVAIDPHFHGLALSELLLEEADRISKLWAASGIYLHVQDGAEKVAALYEKHGYVRDPSGDKIALGNKLLGYMKALEKSRDTEIV